MRLARAPSLVEACGHPLRDVPGRGIARPSSMHVVDANLGPLVAAMRHREVKTSLLRHEQRRASPGSRGNVDDPREPVAALILDDVDEPVAAADVDAPARSVVEEIVGIADDLERGTLLPRGGVEDEDSRGSPTADEHSMV